MSTDPADLGTLEGGTGGDPGTLTPPASDPRDAEIAELKQENARLREERRGERARALGAELKLPATAIELLKTVPADQIEEKAKALAAELAGTPATPPAAPSGGSEPLPPPSEPPDPSLAAFGHEPGGPQPEPALSFQDELKKRIADAEDMKEIEAIQREFRERSRSGSTVI